MKINQRWAATFAAMIASLGALIIPYAASACELHPIAEFHLVMHGNQPVMEATINGRRAPLLVDTGSTYNVLWRQPAKDLGLALRPLDGYEFFGVGGGDQAQTANVHELKLGDMVLHDRDFVVTGERSSLGAVIGTLGANLFTQTDVEFDFPHRVIRLFDEKNCKGDQVVYWGQAYTVAPIAPSNDDLRLDVNVMINGQHVLAQIDTGASTSVLTTGAAARVGMSVGTKGVIDAGRSTGIGLKSVQDYMATFTSFSIGDQETIKNAKLRIADLFAYSAEVPINSRLARKIDDLPDMLLGADFFLSHRVYLAKQQGKIYFSYQGGPIFQMSAQTQPSMPESPTPAAEPPTGAAKP